jgi:hypothetical protein
MANQTIATELLRVLPAKECNRHALQYRMPTGEMGELLFPSDQLDALIEAALVADRTYLGKSEGAAPTPAALLAESFQLGLQLQTETVLLDLRVGNRTFAFALFREQAQKLMTLMREMLPAH